MINLITMTELNIEKAKIICNEARALIQLQNAQESMRILEEKISTIK